MSLRWIGRRRWARPCRALVGLALLVAGLPFASVPSPAAAAKVRHVPGDYPTIQAAIAAAVPGDTVLVDPGTYLETLTFRGKAITVASAQGPAVTVIDGHKQGSAVTFASGEGAASVLSGFTVQHGAALSLPSDADGGGILIRGASPTIAGNVITANSAFVGGGGIAIQGGSPTIRGNQISRNYQDEGSGGIGGGGIEVEGPGTAQILNNTITANSFSVPGGGIALNSASPLIQDNVITSNQGGGIFAQNYSAPAIVQNLITGNQGLGIGLSPASGTAGATLVVANTIADNSYFGVQTSGAAHQIQLVNNIVVAGGGLAAVFCDATYDPQPPALSSNDAYSGGAPALQGSCQGAIGSNGNLSQDPRFVNPPGGDYRLQPDSPAIDAGDNGAPDLPPTDLAGNPRTGPYDPRVDQGAYESQPPQVELEGTGGASVANLAQAESRVAIVNGTPGMPGVAVLVNGTSFQVTGLTNGEVRTLDVSSAMVPGDSNAMTFTALGKPAGNAEAEVVIFR